MFKDFIDMPWLQSFLPDRMRTVDDDILSEPASLQLIQETERILDKLIEQSSKYQSNRTINKKSINFKITIKIKKKKILVQMQDLHQSHAPVKKRIYIECFRKYFKAVDGVGKCVDSTVHYIQNRRTYVRNVRKSPYMQAIFYKIDMLDDALLGQLVTHNKAPLSPVPPTSSSREVDLKKNEEVKLLLMETKRFLQHKNSITLDPILENRLNQIFKHTDKLIPQFELLDIEDRYTVKRMFREDIPNLLHTYLSLSKENQLQQKENIFIALSKMELTIIRLTEILEKNRIERMNHLLKLNEIRYTNK
ncbi:hypothetical protein [Bacillus alkalicellulosilyticus]|uniref:hypothetical protein n=1 Tax=Alkalihalobacterium alkalicellulosilyticum TaxID=1912214 RepID=UPI0009977C99|nr:hypothetical protein [Bacillus alkalicellulosilyticus]